MRLALLPTIVFAVIVSAFTISSAVDSSHAVPGDRAFSDVEQLVAMLEENTKAFHEAISGLTEQQWNFHESEDRWSIGEVAEHIVISEGLLSGMIGGVVLASEPSEAAADSVTVTDEEVVALMADRSQKFKAPEQGIPKGVYATPEEAVAAFDEARKSTMQLLQTDKDLRKHVGPHPAFGTIDGYQWFLFIASHANRHLAQIEQVKSHANYPAA